MRVFGQGLILAGLLCAVAPSVATAAPIGLGDGGCGLVTSPECRLLNIDPFAFDGLTGTLGTFGDIALFAFTFDEDTHLTVTTSSYAGGSFDPTLGLFDDDGSILEFMGAEARFFDADPDTGDYDDRIDLVLGSGSYLMALIAFPNDFGGTPTSLQGVFSCDDLTLCPGVPGAFSFEFAARPDGQPEPVPEPGTLVLLGSGALVFVRHRKKRPA